MASHRTIRMQLNNYIQFLLDLDVVMAGHYKLAVRMMTEQWGECQPGVSGVLPRRRVRQIFLSECESAVLWGMRGHKLFSVRRQETGAAFWLWLVTSQDTAAPGSQQESDPGSGQSREHNNPLAARLMFPWMWKLFRSCCNNFNVLRMAFVGERNRLDSNISGEGSISCWSI